MQARIKLNLVSEVTRLAEIAQSRESDIMLRHNSYVVDATSILGIMSLNLSEPVYIDVIERNEGDALNLYKQLQDEKFEIKVTEG